ncbi:hypothetical protein TVAG_002870 [Trichomonas vaginalis G3]|uniref:Uncharacterized protein n=1 Tax=Trichomonas vaginalis (strain ATCC PRA-98 / G3) TaxID=412133 RepID=A2EZR0_TRIV3|nr:retrograde vesicle-mediated transport, Golgi to ER [Trichomonas vaginalis G3]EAY01832.1 hypothetical protein TVAG_002870 [Trichomonas vaginalis G3]KAI5497556.1 retrograde vesicle-mediated transport, Golgi to ER [Trichomonas vaginalis G3]|eukprot:XP_001314379.1 hypothetical protein [Trichomonas vaginalis G3]
MENNNIITDPSTKATKIATFLCILHCLLSFLAYLPRFQPYIEFKGDNFYNKFPKIWILFSGSFVSDSIFSLFFACLGYIYTSRILERIWGSKEYLRYVTMTCIYANLLQILLIGLLYLITQNKLFLSRKFDTGGALSMAMVIAIAKVFKDISVPTQCGNFKPKYLPFIFYIVSLFFLPISGCDNLLSSIMGTNWAILYLRYLQPHNGKRGDKDVSLDNLIPNPFCSCCSGLQEDDPNDPELANQFRGQARMVTPDGQEYHPPNPDNDRINRPQQPRRDIFTGTAHRIE